MKKLNKYLLLLAAAVFTFTACEKDIEREPSPVFEGESSVTFPISSVSLEYDPTDALEYKVVVNRVEKDSAYAALEVKLNVAVNTSSIFEVPEAVQFEKGAKSTAFVVKFPNAQIDSTYVLALTLGDNFSDPYQVEKPTFVLQVNVAKWNDVPGKKAIIFDGLVNAFYGIGNPGWYVKYQRKENADGSFDIRLLNPYASIPDYTIEGGKPNYDKPVADKFGLYKGFPYNYPEDIDSLGTYNMVIHIAKNGKATFDDFAMGMSWSYGAFTAKYYDPTIPGVWDKEKQSVTFPAGSSACFMATAGGRLTSEDIVVFINDSLWQDEHSAITIASLDDEFNDASIQWNVVAGDLHTLVSEIDSEVKDLTLLNAIDPNVKEKQGPGSDFYNLFYLANIFEKGYGLAFYWDSIKGKLALPEGLQPMGRTFASKKIYLAPSAETESYVEEIDLKGDKVTVFHFFLQVQSKDGGNLGEYEEVFYLGPNEIIWTEEDYLGNFIMSGKSFFGLPAAEMPVKIAKSGDDMFIVGVDFADTIWVDFDAATGTMAIIPQMLGDFIDEESGDTLDVALYTYVIPDGPGVSSPIVLSYGFKGLIETVDNSPAIGYLLSSQAAGGYIDGYYNLTFTPAVQAAAPRRVSSVKTFGTPTFKAATKKANNWKLKGQVKKHNYRLK